MVYDLTIHDHGNYATITGNTARGLMHLIGWTMPPRTLRNGARLFAWQHVHKVAMRAVMDGYTIEYAGNAP